MRRIALAAAMVALFATAADAETLAEYRVAREKCERGHTNNFIENGHGSTITIHADRPDLWAASVPMLPEGIVLASCEDGYARLELIPADMGEVKRALGLE